MLLSALSFTRWYEANGYWERVVTSEDGADGGIHADEIERIARARILAAG